ncbi:uncharacterized protein C22orf15 homolog isoform X3 [Mesocricetus auratus]|uniref:Uncharacterized protein C22orf15 homolog isoform X3 n=1 Tax=Mesocricetus auratus TaxID=10036 RepID=A0ABM2WIC8_MESAU|nr:uncharacterized protein C22orf15 homolog isoform X3 [Mesocricetus auratus]
MFITVMFGAGCRVLVNPWCSLVTFIKHLKQKAQLPPEVTIALLAEDGHLVSLEEEIAQAPSMACSLLQEQGTYILVQRSWAGSPAFQAQATVREDAQAFGVATGNTVPFQGLGGWPPYHLETASWSQSQEVL